MGKSPSGAQAPPCNEGGRLDEPASLDSPRGEPQDVGAGVMVMFTVSSLQPLVWALLFASPL